MECSLIRFGWERVLCRRSPDLSFCSSIGQKKELLVTDFKTMSVPFLSLTRVTLFVSVSERFLMI